MKITGKIVDSKNESLPLANITLVSGSTANKEGVQANENGEFVFDSQNITPTSKIKVSYVGYNPQEFLAEELNDKTIKLLELTESLDEVVIRPKAKPTSKANENAKQKFVLHFQKHKSVYAGIGGLLGIVLIIMSIKKIK